MGGKSYIGQGYEVTVLHRNFLGKTEGFKGDKGKTE